MLAHRDGARTSHDDIAAMCARLRHRGPDDDGVYCEGAVGLGATRLAIIDLQGGHQPMPNEDGTVWVVQNGEIYNYRALRDALVARNHRFSTTSDTEVIVHLYEDEGTAFVERLHGMFAIAVWDASRRRLTLARDRLGIKPIFYADTPDAFLFGSEIKALLATGLDRHLDLVALSDYLSFDYVPGPRTMFEGVRKLPAGHVLTAEPGAGVRLERYWDFPPQPDAEESSVQPDPRTLRDDLHRRLEAAVRSTMVSDVPIGAFLSGGLDSSVVVALMGRLGGERVRTFSVGFPERSYNELPYARTVADHCGTDHTEIVIEPHAESVVHELVDAFDEPFADSSAVASWYVAEAASAHTKVVLSGDGGDEVFGGYVIYQADKLAGLYRALPDWLGGRLLPDVVDRLPSSHEKMSWDLKVRRFVTHASGDPASAHAGWRVVFTDAAKAALFAPGVMPVRDSLATMREAYAAYPGSDALNRFMVVDAKVSLVDDMLAKVDRTSMAHGLEVRVPLLDHDLVSWMTVIPSRYKVRRLRLKYLLKEVARSLLPAEIVDRPKAGFHVPMPQWLNGPLRPLIETHLGRAAVARQGLFNPETVDRLRSEHDAGRRDHSRNLWGLLVFSLWYDRHMRSH